MQRQTTETNGVIHALIRDSSNVRELHYTIEDDLLEVKYQKPKEETPRIHRYFMVPRYEFDALIESDSIGKYLSANIIGIYTEEKVN